jgi:hypothetical protein
MRHRSLTFRSIVAVVSLVCPAIASLTQVTMRAPGTSPGRPLAAMDETIGDFKKE